VHALLTSLPPAEQARFLTLLQEMLAIPLVAIPAALDRAGQLVGQAFAADKVDILLYDAAMDTLVAVGTNASPMAHQERALGLDRLPLANGGRVVEVYQTGHPYLNGQVDQDPLVLPDFREALGIRSMVVAPLAVNGARRGCVTLSSRAPNQFQPDQLPVIGAVAQWVGLVVHQAELVERRATDAAEQARRLAAEELITILAHDLNNHLTPLVTGVQLLQRRAERDGRSADIRTAGQVARTVGRLRALIDDLLDVERLEQGLLTLRVEPVDLVTLAQQTARVLATADAPIDVRAPAALQVEADANRIRQALENLLANAQKHTPPGVPVQLAVAQRRDHRGTWAVLQVRDKGPGVPPTVLPHLFTRFGAGQASIGLGLGLYLAERIAVAHGGTVEAASVPGEGATFSLALPTRQPPA